MTFPMPCSMSRQKNQSIVNWGETHEKYVKEWNEWKCRKDTERRVIDWNEFEDHLRWYDDGTKYRLRLRPQWTTADAEELYDDCSENEAYNESIRELNSGFREYAPLMNRVVSRVCLFSTGFWMKCTVLSVSHLLFCSLRS
jgi:hypothetical protein